MKVSRNILSIFCLIFFSFNATSESLIGTYKGVLSGTVFWTKDECTVEISESHDEYLKVAIQIDNNEKFSTVIKRADLESAHENNKVIEKITGSKSSEGNPWQKTWIEFKGDKLNQVYFKEIYLFLFRSNSWCGKLERVKDL
ncbi:MAG: hypothetical protein H6731_01600 [Myxococcales bacterium]|nr:MAG: hypothetical protein H6731_01600 [Myxococcales bacterium]